MISNRLAIALALCMTLLAATLDWLLLGLLPDLDTYMSPLRISASTATYGISALFFWASFRSSMCWRWLYWLGFAIATFIEYGYVAATGKTSSPADIAVALQNTQYWGAMLSIAVNGWASIIVGIYGIALCAIPPGSGRHATRLAFVCMACLTFHTAVLTYSYVASNYYRYVVMVRSSMVTGTSQAFVRSAVSYTWAQALNRWVAPKHEPLAFRSSTTPNTHIVFVIDESVRADHLSINGYSRPTTPWLQSLQRNGKLSNWTEASSAAISSWPSVVALFSGVLLPDREGKAYTQPSIFHYAKAMGYETHILDGQASRPEQRSVLDDLMVLDHFTGTGDLGRDWDTDTRMAKEIKQLLTATNGQFIVALKRGNHIPYYKNYPPNERRWAPEKVTGKLKYGWDPEIWEQWVDSYDEGLRHNLDTFFRHFLFEDGSLPRTVVIYTSDHGVPYYPENDAQWRTASAVPLMMLGDLRPQVDTAYRASHNNLFATLLDLMQFPATERPFVYGRSLLEATSTDTNERKVFGGEDYDFTGIGNFNVRDFDQLAAPPLDKKDHRDN